jgi:hypothetical protein
MSILKILKTAGYLFPVLTNRDHFIFLILKN